CAFCSTASPEENSGSCIGSLRANFRLRSAPRGRVPHATATPQSLIPPRFRMSRRADFILQANAAYIDEQHRRWLENPRSVPEDWALFFAGVDFGETGRSGTAAGQDTAFALVHAYREFGHWVARLDPLADTPQPSHPSLDLAA